MKQEFMIGATRGMDVYSPGVAAQDSAWTNLKNVNVRGGFFQTPGLLTAVTGNPLSALGSIKSFGIAYDVANIIASIYVFGKNNFGFYLSGAYGVAASVPSGYTVSEAPVASVGWNDILYATRPGFPVTSISGDQATTIDSSFSTQDTNLSGRYMTISNGHLMIANVRPTNGSNVPIRVQWSDLYQPEEWQILETNEADFFDLDANNFEITGLTNQRGRTLIFTVNSIWQAIYVGFAQGIYKFDIAFTEVGNYFHYSHIQVRGTDFFIGSDNVYALQGASLQPIGDPIWSYFKSTAASFEQGAEVIASVNRRNNEVFWTYTNSAESNAKWQIVYNYRENKWSHRSAQSANAMFSLDGDIRVYDDTWDSIEDEWGEVTETWDEIATYTILNQQSLHGGQSGVLYEQSDVQRPLAGELQTFEYYYNSAFEVKTLDRVKLLLSKTGSPTITVAIGVRDSLSEAISWTSDIVASTGTDFDGEEIYYVRGSASTVGKYFQFKIKWTNSTDNFVDRFLGLSIILETYQDNDDR